MQSSGACALREPHISCRTHVAGRGTSDCIPMMQGLLRLKCETVHPYARMQPSRIPHTAIRLTIHLGRVIIAGQVVSLAHADRFKAELIRPLLLVEGKNSP